MGSISRSVSGLSVTCVTSETGDESSGGESGASKLLQTRSCPSVASTICFTRLPQLGAGCPLKQLLTHYVDVDWGSAAGGAVPKVLGHVRPGEDLIAVDTEEPVAKIIPQGVLHPPVSVWDS